MKRFFILLLLIQVSTLFPQNSEELVEEKLEIVLQELDRDNRGIWDLPPFFKNMIEFIIQMNAIFRIIFILLLVSFFIFAIYKISRLFVRNTSYGTSSIINTNTKSNAVNPPIDYLKSALERSQKQEYSQAIIFLHKGSVHSLFKKSLLTRGRDYTNREIQNIISDGKTSDAFYHIAQNAELITFKGKNTVVDDYIKLEQLYRRYFL